MGGKEEEYRVFVGGLSGDVTKRQLEDAFSRFGKILDSQVMLERDTGRPRGFGFLTYTNRRGMDDAIREMHGIELGDRVISVNKAKPRMGGGDDPGNGYSGGGGYSSGGRGSSFGGGGDRSLGQDECFKCGRPGHWARDCPLAGGAQFSSRPRFGGTGGRYGDHDRFIDDRYDGGPYGDRDWYDSRDIKYGPRDHYINDRYLPRSDRFGGEKYSDRYYSDRYPVNGYRKEREYERDGHSSSDRYGGGGGPTRGYQGKSYRDRAGPSGPYDRPRRGSGRPPSYNRY